MNFEQIINHKFHIILPLATATAHQEPSK